MSYLGRSNHVPGPLFKMSGLSTDASPPGETRWKHLPLEIRRIIIREVLDSSVPIPIDGKRGFQACQQQLKTLLLISRSFTSDDVVEPLSRLIHVLIDLYESVARSQVVLIQTCDDEQRKSQLACDIHDFALVYHHSGRVRTLLDVYKQDVEPIRVHLLACQIDLFTTMFSIGRNPEVCHCARSMITVNASLRRMHDPATTDSIADNPPDSPES